MSRFVSALMTVLLLGACASDTGPVGPSGSQGQPGLQGPGGPEGPQGPEGRPLNWADVIEEWELEDAVYALGFVDDQLVHVGGTGFVAHYNNTIWTNAHVVNGLKMASRDRAHFNPVFFAAKAGAYNETTGSLDPSQLHLLDLNNSRVHPDYDGTVYSPDIGFFVVDAEFTSGAILLPREYVDELRLGQPIGTLGFPGEIGPTFTPTFKDGVISAFRTNRRGTAAQNVAIQHNFDTTGGTSCQRRLKKLQTLE